MSKILYLFLFFLSASIAPANPPVISGKVISIADGDTFTIFRNHQSVRIRVDAIDAPEKGMPYAKASKKYLSALCFGKIVTLKPVKTDRYGRTVARVVLPDGKDLSVEMIRAGYAWHYKKYSNDPFLSALEKKARNQKMGLWRDEKAMAPWEVRALHRRGISTKRIFESAAE